MGHSIQINAKNEYIWFFLRSLKSLTGVKFIFYVRTKKQKDKQTDNHFYNSVNHYNVHYLSRVLDYFGSASHNSVNFLVNGR